MAVGMAIAAVSELVITVIGLIETSNKNGQAVKDQGNYNTSPGGVPGITTTEHPGVGPHQQGAGPTTYDFNGQSYSTMAQAQAAQNAWIAANPQTSGGGGTTTTGGATDPVTTKPQGGNGPVDVGSGQGDKPVTEATDAAQVAQEKYVEGETSIGVMRGQLDTAILGQQASEIQAEGAISASVAARGLKMEGSPLMQMMSEQQRATTALNYTKQQGTAAISGAGTGLQASYDAANLASTEQIQYADTQLANAWLDAFSNIIDTGSYLAKGPGGSSGGIENWQSPTV